MMDDAQIHLGWENGQPGEKEADTILYMMPGISAFVYFLTSFPSLIIHKNQCLFFNFFDVAYIANIPKRGIQHEKVEIGFLEPVQNMKHCHKKKPSK
jgi:hypothetical protein